MRTLLLIVTTLVIGTSLQAQLDEHVAYVPAKPPHRTADDTRMGLTSGTLPGMMEFQVPADTYRIDVLNARGKVKESRSGAAMGQLDLNVLRPGTWTLRAHTRDGLLVRRFMVVQQGRIAWAAPPTGKAR